MIKKIIKKIISPEADTTEAIKKSFEPTLPPTYSDDNEEKKPEKEVE